MADIDDMLKAAGAPARQETPTAQSAKSDAAEKPGRSMTDKAEKPRRPKPDKYLVGIYVVLCLISTIELYSASSREVTSGNIFGPLIRHLLMLGLGIAICISVSRVKIKYFVTCTPLFVFISVLMMLFVLVAGQNINGAQRSFSLAGIQIQPAELLKISAVLVIAFIISRNLEKRGVKTSGVAWCAGWVVLFGALLFSQGLTNTILLMAISLSMMLIGGIQWRKFFIVIAIYGIVGGLGIAIKGNQGRGNTWNGRMERFNSEVPLYEQPVTTENLQEMYSYMAQANGGLFGVMPGNSREASRLPLAFSDYIYSIVVEDLGFLGGLFLLGLYLSLLARAGIIASRCDRAFPALVVMGLAVMIAFQALFHMAIVTGVFPVSGQPLPMISKGGTSMLVTSLAFGMMLSISRYASQSGGRRKGRKTIQVTDLPEAVGAANPTQIK